MIVALNAWGVWQEGKSFLMVAQDYLLEVGTEELPASFLHTVVPELTARVSTMLEGLQLPYGSIEVQLTPRRIALWIKALEAQQPDTDEWVKGPPASHAFDDSGQPTKAAQGFAQKMGVSVDQLQRQTVGDVEYVAVHQHRKGQSVFECLPNHLPEVVLSLPGSHFMAWDESEIRFSRPIRWCLSLYGDQPIPLTFGLTPSANQTIGHRFFAAKTPIAVNTVEEYVPKLRQEGNVWVNIDERKQQIWKDVKQKAAELGGSVEENPDLLDMVAMLVETPTIVEGRFNESFLVLPKEVITTVMTSHQKYFPVIASHGGLLPYFLTVSNNPSPEAKSYIQLGNEKVLKARLDDAAFFFHEDTKQPLEGYVEALKGMAFQKGLGSMYDRTLRLQNLVAALAPLLKVSTEDLHQAQRAAWLCKADLATLMVRELTELQGVVGAHYARHAGEAEPIAKAIEAHYWPRFQGDAIAQDPVSVLLSLADKLDTLFAVFSQKDARLPTGSKDPMGLRRMANGLLLTVIHNPWSLDLTQAFSLAFNNLGALAKDSESVVIERVSQFMLQRFKGSLLEQSYSYDAIDAVFGADPSLWSDLHDVMKRLDQLKAFQQNEAVFKPVYESANRTSKILGDGYDPTATLDQVDEGLLKEPAEQHLFQTLKPIFEAMATEPREAWVEHWRDQFQTLSPAIVQFFEAVLVNADDAAVKTNRYRLLSAVNRLYRSVADFTKLVV